MKKLLLPLLIAAGLIGSASADTFGTGANQFSIDFTTIGNPGNAADTTGYGSVGYSYRIGTYTISQNQIDAATASGLQNVTAGRWRGDQPAANISWYEAAAYVNWLNTSTGHQAAYNLSYSAGSWSMSLWNSFDPGYNSYNRYRNANAMYFLPSENEWYKAAYGKSDASGYNLYPTANGNPPTPVSNGVVEGTAVFRQDPFNYGNSEPASVYYAGGPSSYGTVGQGGNIWQILESAYDGENNTDYEYRTGRGGEWNDNSYANMQSSVRTTVGYPDYQYQNYGFRVASVIPEPSTYALFVTGAFGLLTVLRKKKTV